MCADWANARRVAGGVMLTFGQTTLDGSALAAALAIEVPYERLAHVMNANPGFVPSLRGYAARATGAPSSPNIKLEARRVVRERASVVTIAFLADDADIRFYRISAGDLTALRAGYSPEFVHPVVEISMNTALLSSLVDEILGLIENEPPVQGAVVEPQGGA